LFPNVVCAAESTAFFNEPQPKENTGDENLAGFKRQWLFCSYDVLSAMRAIAPQPVLRPAGTLPELCKIPGDGAGNRE